MALGMGGRRSQLEMRYLADVPDAISTLSKWFLQAWEPYYGVNGPGEAESDLRESLNRDRLPMCLLATDRSGALAGTISLKAESISHSELTPWGAAFVVEPTWRRQGVGTILVGFLEHEARRLGYRRLYMSTDAANAIVEGRGWHSFDTAESLRGTITVYAIDL